MFGKMETGPKTYRAQPVIAPDSLFIASRRTAGRIEAAKGMKKAAIQYGRKRTGRPCRQLGGALSQVEKYHPGE